MKRNNTKAILQSDIIKIEKLIGNVLYAESYTQSLIPILSI